MEARMSLENKNYIVHPLRFAMWLFLLTVIMIFGSLTSAYLVNKSFLAQPMIYDLPSVLMTNLIVILFSSIPMQYAVWAGKRGEHTKALLALVMTLVLGILFIRGQFQAWAELTASGLPLVDTARTDAINPGRVDNTVSFFYIFTGLHVLHLVAAIIAVVVVLIKTLAKKYTAKGMNMAYELTATFWHFLGALWLYLFLFLKYT
ncbi:MAG: cytochrome c oxidase subunit 3, partial [Bacteroidota bacterium]